MFRRIKLVVLNFILMTIVIIVGNKIHLFLFEKNIDNNSSDVYLTEKEPNLSILIEVDRKALYLIDMDENKVIKKYPVATGKPDSPTPLGTFKIVEKAAWGGGFGSRWMGLNVPWGKYGIHGTNKPGSIGYNASQGCIRMRNEDVKELYSMVKHETLVTLTSGEYDPFGYGLRTLRPGDRGADVAEVQKRLKSKGYYEGSIDGVYGDGMKVALINFLKDNNMSITDNIGYNVYEKLGIIIMD
ncbi:L,D-transpeptidase family protein [Anaerosalibacter massiliensis]|uniref:L,D-transpeptidase family protein n=1 Tax=Anaerosalibacter massiliensis TaxID=1347392 RepID=A0A9X2ME81_9FIRM|nr:L,D-transpeptidase family protein [Anaerosalibacter massiliensis]MCR2043357.1 L,D-transpeptidase family protein [Anaerosalibacter massiliensis]